MSEHGGKSHILLIEKFRLPWELDRPAGVIGTRLREDCDGSISELSYDWLPTISISRHINQWQQMTLTAFAQASH